MPGRSRWCVAAPGEGPSERAPGPVRLGQMPDCVAGEQRPTVSALGRRARPPSWFGARRKVGSGVIDPLRQLPVPTPTHAPPRAGRRLDDRPDPGASCRRSSPRPRSPSSAAPAAATSSTPDPNVTYSIPAIGASGAAVVVAPHGVYATISGARWINTTGSTGDDQASSQTTEYSITFSLPAGFSGPSITVQLVADNAGTVLLNGVQIGQQPQVDTSRQLQHDLDVHQRHRRELPRRLEHADHRERRLRQHRTASTSRPS